MIRLDRDALICDFAETYRIYDIWSLPARLAATYAVGLRADSRIMMKINGMKVPFDTLLLATTVDLFRLFLWSNSDDGHKNINKPESIAGKLFGDEEENSSVRKNTSFNSSEEFEATRNKLIQKILDNEKREVIRDG